MNFKQRLAEYKATIDVATREFFRIKSAEAARVSPTAKKYVDVLAEYTSRGGAKRIRGILVRVGYELFGGKKTKAITDISVALEVFHGFILIHDDIIDRSETRRGKPTVHRVFERQYKKQFGTLAPHIGTSLAIILGDTGQAFSYQLISNSKFSEQKNNAAIKLMNENLEYTAYGELLDILGGSSKKDIDAMYVYKTALYTFVNPITVGALYAGMPPKNISRLRTGGQKVGVAFQIQDDIIDLFGDSRKSGKAVGTDIHEKKMTALIFEARKRASSAQLKKLDTIWKKKRITKTDIIAVQDIVETTGSLAYNQRQSEKLVASAKKDLSALRNVNNASKQFLIDLADYIITRTK